jgi:nucleotide-binding universal stress UspA family protein
VASKEILVAVDASTRSETLVSYACATAASLGATVHLLYVEPVMRIPPEFKAYARQENVDPEGYNEAVGQAVLNKLEGIAKSAGVGCDTDLEHGNPAAVILKFGSEPGVAMVVVGLRGLHGVGRVRSLGSVARRVVENSKVPVVVVPT